MAYNTYDPAIAARKRQSAEIFRETTKCIQAGGYTTPSGKQIRFDFSGMLRTGKCFHRNPPAEIAQLFHEVIPEYTSIAYGEEQ